jgi:hypothetical protein
VVILQHRRRWSVAVAVDRGIVADGATASVSKFAEISLNSRDAQGRQSCNAARCK